MRANDNKKETVLAIPSTPRLPGEDTAILLSSKGAEARLTHSVAPKYPAEARAGGADGTVVLKAVVDDSGKVEGVRLVEGNAILAPAAIQAVKEWRYRPYVRDGKAQPFQTLVIVDFQAASLVTVLVTVLETHDQRPREVICVNYPRNLLVPTSLPRMASLWVTKPYSSVPMKN